MTTDRARPLAAFVVVTLLCTAILVLNLAQSPRSVVVTTNGAAQVDGGPDVIFGNLIAGAPVKVTASAIVTRPVLSRAVTRKTKKATAHHRTAAAAARKPVARAPRQHQAKQGHQVPTQSSPGRSALPGQHQHKPVHSNTRGHGYGYANGHPKGHGQAQVRGRDRSMSKFGRSDLRPGDQGAKRSIKRGKGHAYGHSRSDHHGHGHS